MAPRPPLPPAQITQNDPGAREALTNYLLTLLGDSDSDLRYAGAAALGEITQDDPNAREAVTKALITRLGDTDSSVRSAAATAIGQIKQDNPNAREAVTKALITRLGDTDSSVRSRAAAALGEIRQDDLKTREAVTEALITRLGDTDNIVDSYVAATLGKGRMATTMVTQSQPMPCVPRRAAADAFAANVLPIVRQLQANGLTDLRSLAAALNERGVRTARGGQWHQTTVRNLLARA